MGKKPKTAFRLPIAVNLRAARLAAGFETISDAARHIGIPVPTATAHEGAAKSFRRPKLEQLRKYAAAYNTTIDALEGGIITPPLKGHSVKTREIPQQSSLVKMPILCTAQAGLWCEVDPFQAEAASGVAYAAVEKEGAFGANVAGDSMNRLLQDGDVAIIRPWRFMKRDPRNNDVVLVQRERGGKYELTVKTYRDNQLWPESTNPKWRHPVPMKDGDTVTVVGLVVGLYRPI